MYIVRQFIIRILRFVFALNMKKHQMRIGKNPYKHIIDKDKIRFTERLMGDEADGIVKAGSYLLIYCYVVFALLSGGIFYFCIVYSTKMQCDVGEKLAILGAYVLYFLLIQVIKFAQMYYMSEITMFYDDVVLVRSYRHADRYVSYEEIGEMVRKNGVRVRAGALEIPYKEGKIKIRIYEQDPLLDKRPLITFLNEKCEINLPELTKYEMRLIRESGVFSVFSKIAMTFWAFDFLFMVVAYLSEMSTTTFLQVYFPGTIRAFLKTHILFSTLGLPCLVLGGSMKLINCRPFKKHLSKYEIFNV